MNLFRPVAGLFVVLFVFILQARPEATSDSLKQSLAVVVDGYPRIDLYLEISKSFKSTNIDSAIFYAEQARISALREDDDKRVAEALFTLGKIGLRQDSSLLARKRLYSALTYADRCKCDSLKASILMFLGKSYTFQDNYAEAIFNFMKSLELAEKIDNKLILADLLDDIGLVMTFLTDFDGAMIYFEKALKISTEIGDKKNLATTLRNIGFIHEARKDYLQAEASFMEALKIYTQLNYFPGMSTSNLGIGNTQFAMGNYSIALNYYMEALAFAEKIDFNSKVSGPYIMTFCYNRLGRTYIKLGKYSEAIDVLRKSNDLSEEFGMPGRKSATAFIFSKVYEKLGNVSLAFDYFKLYNMLSDSIINARNVSSITKLQMEYEYLKEQKEIELQAVKKEASFERKMLLYKLLIAIAVVILVLLIVILILYRKNESNKAYRAELRERNLELEKENLQTELDFKNKELTTNVMYQLKKNNFIWSISEKLKELTIHLRPDNKKSIKDVIKELDSNMSKESWEEFEIRFNEVHNKFYENLIKEFPDLTPNELKLSAFLKLNMTTKDIGTITYQTAHSITVARHRLRAKLGLERDANLVSFLAKY